MSREATKGPTRELALEFDEWLGVPDVLRLAAIMPGVFERRAGGARQPDDSGRARPARLHAERAQARADAVKTSNNSCVAPNVT